ncbi:MAG: hypothetical protein ABUM51_08705 [Bacteroidota bacterium]
MLYRNACLFLFLTIGLFTRAQDKALVNTLHSRHVSMGSINMGDVQWRRGPVVYCLESPDLSAGTNLFNVAMPAHPHLVPVATKMGNARIMSLRGTAKLLPSAHWENKLYQDLSPAPATDIPIRLVPYYTWANRGASDMTVWLPVMQ